MSELYIGLMSGTSMDGIDGVVAEFAGTGMRVVEHASLAFEPSLQQELLALNSVGPNELHRAALAANALARAYARVCHELLARLPAGHKVRAIGAHGQTVRHQPGRYDGTGYTIQLNQPALLAELTGLTVVSDFRSRDVAAGGQGAPLVPAFHRAAFATEGQAVAVLNLGGISNLSILGADGSVLGFDCGPGNLLMDLWCLKHTGHAFDRDGLWAASGEVVPELMEALWDEPFFDQAPPKSTGRDLFNPAWLDARLQRLGHLRAQDVQASLLELTAGAIARDLHRHAPAAARVIVCGGGAMNGALLRRLQSLLPQQTVHTSDEHGLPPQQVEAAAFAWLAHHCLHGQPANVPAVTGSRGLRVLGSITPG